MSDVHSFGRDLEYERNEDHLRGTNNSNNSNVPVISSTVSTSSEVQHLRDLASDLEALYLSDEHSDVIFVLDDGERIPAHRLILAARSPYFRALLYNGMIESEEKEVRLVDTNSTAFLQILRYAYTSNMNLNGVELDVLLEFLSLAHRYDLLTLVNSIGDYFKEIININNVCNILNAAHFFSLGDLTEYCLRYCDRHALQVLTAPSFVTLSADSLAQLLQRDSFYATELSIFLALKHWAESNPDDCGSIKVLLSFVRLPLITQNELLSIVRPTKLIDPDALLDAISIQNEPSSSVNYRGVRIPDVNIATSFNGAMVLSSDNENGKKLLCEEIPEDQRAAIHYNPRQANQYASKQGIIIDLGRPHIINLIIIDLCSKSELQLYSYIVEVCINIDNESDWKTVADYSDYACRRRQRIFFDESVIKYVRIRCADRILPKVIVKRFEALYSSKRMPVDPYWNIVAPDDNVATIENYALVVEGVSRCRNALINGEISNYDWDTGYTCHQIGSGGIIVELPQPYLLSTMRILLWDCDDRFYSYYVAVSTNQNDWSTVVDRTKKKCRGWQLLKFDPTPVVFIKLVGTRNSTNEVFHVVHLEAPATLNAPPPSVNECEDFGENED